MLCPTASDRDQQVIYSIATPVRRLMVSLHGDSLPSRKDMGTNRQSMQRSFGLRRGAYSLLSQFMWARPLRLDTFVIIFRLYRGLTIL